MRFETIGSELEGGLYKNDGTPANAYLALNCQGVIKSQSDQFEAVTTDLGISSIEYVTAICRSPEDIERSFARCSQLIPGGYRAVFETKPFGDTVHIAPKVRYRLISEALLREHERGDQCIHTVAPYSSLQYHIGIGDIMTPASVLFLDFLNNIGPHARMQVIERYKVKGAEKHLMCWQGWSDSRRVPHPFWFDSPEALEMFVREIPKVVDCSADGKWSISHSMSDLKDDVSMATIWWLTRPRASFGTHEWRCFPSIPVKQATELSGDVARLSSAFMEHVNDHAHEFLASPQSAAPIYRHLSTISDLVPPEPLSIDRWHELYAL
ncbi:MAG: hypothetical protein JO019_00090 [Candidatus Kaiserbacteria bacterium]|nr:hypothetical protein [Candidatus Kaiserbacteria bacterium]